MKQADPVREWLREGDPAIRWHVTGSARERAKIAREGWGSRLLALQADDGMWGGGLYTPKWISTTYTLLLLKAIGLAGGNRKAARGARLLLDNGLYRDGGINFWTRWRNRSETCVTAMALGIAARFLPNDARLDALAGNLLAEQMPDGGWNCMRYRGATHSSVHTTISALEGLLEYEAAGGKSARKTAAARERAHEFLLAHRLCRSHRTGAVMDPRMTRFAFPPQWHYDVLRGLHYFAAAGVRPDERARDAVELVVRRRRPDGRWTRSHHWPGREHFPMEEKGAPSRWVTLQARRILAWWEGADPGARHGPATPC
jgi:hypothetical protein